MIRRIDYMVIMISLITISTNTIWWEGFFITSDEHHSSKKHLNSTYKLLYICCTIKSVCILQTFRSSSCLYYSFAYKKYVDTQEKKKLTSIYKMVCLSIFYLLYTTRVQELVFWWIFLPTFFFVSLLIPKLLFFFYMPIYIH